MVTVVVMSGINTSLSIPWRSKMRQQAFFYPLLVHDPQSGSHSDAATKRPGLTDLDVSLKTTIGFYPVAFFAAFPYGWCVVWDRLVNAIPSLVGG